MYSKKRRPITSAFQGLQLLLIQSSVCILLIVVFLCLRLVGGSTYTKLSAMFQNAMLDDTVISAVSNTVHLPKVQAMTVVKLPEKVLKISPLKGGVITSHFGMRDGVFHEGVDIAADKGTPLMAFMDGTVTVSEFDEKGYGHYLVVTCSGGEKYLYAHCESLIVKAGDQVRAGDIVAYVGNTGRSSGDHLHMEWICNGEPLDPLTVIPRDTYV